MKNISKFLAIALFMGFGLLTAVSTFPQAGSAAPSGNPPSGNVSPNFTGLTVTGASTLNSATVQNGLTVSGGTTSTGNLTASGTVDLKGDIENSTTIGICPFCFGSDVSINDNLTVSGNSALSGTATVSGNATFNGNATIKGNTTLGDASTDLTTIKGDLKTERFMRAYVDANGMGGIGRFYNKSAVYNVNAGNTYNYNSVCDDKDWAVSCSGGFLSNVGANYIVNAVWRSGGQTCNIKGQNSSAAVAAVTLQTICYAPNENWYYDNGSWRIMYYDGTLSAPLGL